MVLLLSITPVVGHHILRSVPWLSADQEHWAVVCLVALHQLLAPIHQVAHWLLYAGLTFAIVERGRALLRHARVMKELRFVRVEATSELGAAATRAGLSLARLRVVHGLPMPAFTTGWFAPRVVVAADLSLRLNADELTAVLAHEAVHLRRRDPTRLFALRALASLLFWLPALRRLAADLEDEVEIMADDEVAKTLPLALASAVLKLGGGDVRIPITVGFQRADLLPRRIRRLAGEDAAVVSHISTSALVAAAAALLLTALSGVMVLHPLQGPNHSAASGPAHCNHPQTNPLTHLFCRGWTIRSTAGQEQCPHESALAAMSAVATRKA
ncbi:MAG: M56 family metallopeptidase [Gemmatimonas sp.]